MAWLGLLFAYDYLTSDLNRQTPNRTDGTDAKHTHRARKAMDGERERTMYDKHMPRIRNEPQSATEREREMRLLNENIKKEKKKLKSKYTNLYCSID